MKESAIDVDEIIVLTDDEVLFTGVKHLHGWVGRGGIMYGGEASLLGLCLPVGAEVWAEADGVRGGRCGSVLVGGVYRGDGKVSCVVEVSGNRAGVIEVASSPGHMATNYVALYLDATY